MRVLGLTGGIASGKSLVAEILKQLGAEVIDADEIGHQIMEPGLLAYNEIIDAFGRQILDTEGKVNRKKLGEIVFSCPEQLQSLNRITHPRIFQRISDLLSLLRTQQPLAVVVVEAALLFEIKLNTLVDEVWTVEADLEIQVQRLKERNKLTEEQALGRILSQMPASARIASADKVIYNNGRVDPLFREILEIWESSLD